MRKIVFDLDDTLWPLDKIACRILGIDYAKMTSFNIIDNPALTQDEIQKILELFKNPVLWEYIEWEDKALDIVELEKYDAEVYINSNCANQEVADFKRSFLSNTLHIPNNRIILNVTHSPKIIDSDTFVFVDDSIDNINNSKAIHNIMPAKPWNHSLPNVYRFNEFRDIFNFIVLLLKAS